MRWQTATTLHMHNWTSCFQNAWFINWYDRLHIWDALPANVAIYRSSAEPENTIARSDLMVLYQSFEVLTNAYRSGNFPIDDLLFKHPTKHGNHFIMSYTTSACSCNCHMHVYWQSFPVRDHHLWICGDWEGKDISLSIGCHQCFNTYRATHMKWEWEWIHSS